LYFDPDILILDEATNALDKKTQKKIIDNLLLNYKSKTIIFISHDYSVLENCNKIFEVKNKKLIKIEKGLKTL
jgi:ABC-type bacteriocin/lantibiotic exporter with double-glycine peptidase domain